MIYLVAVRKRQHSVNDGIYGIFSDPPLLFSLFFLKEKMPTMPTNVYFWTLFDANADKIPIMPKLEYTGVIQETLMVSSSAPPLFAAFTAFLVIPLPYFPSFF